MRTINITQFNPVNESSDPRNANEVEPGELQALRDAGKATSTDAGHYHIISADGTKTVEQYNSAGESPFHIHEVKDGIVQEAGDHTHTL